MVSLRPIFSALAQNDVKAKFATSESALAVAEEKRYVQTRVCVLFQEGNLFPMAWMVFCCVLCVLGPLDIFGQCCMVVALLLVVMVLWARLGW